VVSKFSPDSDPIFDRTISALGSPCWARDVNGKNKHSVNVDPADMMLQSSSRSRGGDMSLKSVRANPKDQMC